MLRWIVDGLQSDEINELAATFIPPFNVSPQQVSYYRKTRKADIAALIAAGEQEALSEGLALVGERVRKLKQLAALLARDLFGGFIWTDQVKSIGSGLQSEKVEYEEFNAAEVIQYRGILDDIAKETGGRAQKIEQSGDRNVNLHIVYDGPGPGPGCTPADSAPEAA